MKKTSGFTLIELLAVVLILSILTSIAVPQYRKAIQRTKAANALVNLKTAFEAAKRSYVQSSTWPTGLDHLDVAFFNVIEGNQVDGFAYSFSSTPSRMYIEACLINDKGDTDTYCLRAYYKINTYRDVLTCKALDSAYDSLCESMRGQLNRKTSEGVWLN